MNGYGKVQYSGVTDAGIRGRQMDELIRKKDALDALMTERKHLLASGQKGAEHVLTHHGYNVIDELQPVQSDVPVINVGDMISRQAAIDAIQKLNIPEDMCVFEIISHIEVEIAALPSAQSELADKIRAIGYTGKEGRIYIGGRLFAVRELAQ